MAITSAALVKSKTLENTATTQYDNQVLTAVLDSVTVTNVSGAAVTVSFWLVPIDVALGDSNLVIKEKAIAAGETHFFPELAGKVLDPGDALSASASAASSITLNVSGLEIG